MIDIRSFKNTMKLMIVSMSDGVMEIYRDTMFNDCGDSYEAGETSEDRELKKLQKVWNRGFVCPICGEQSCDAIFSNPIEILDDGKEINSIVEEMVGGKIEPTTTFTDSTPMGTCAFETREEFDRHMRSVHGICIEDALDELPDEEMLKSYGAHYYNFKHAHMIKCEDKDRNHIKIKPHHHSYQISEDFYEDKKAIVEKRKDE